MSVLDLTRRSAVATLSATARLAAVGSTAGAQAVKSNLPGGSLRTVNLPDLRQRQGNFAEVNGARIFYETTGLWVVPLPLLIVRAPSSC